MPRVSAGTSAAALLALAGAAGLQAQADAVAFRNLSPDHTGSAVQFSTALRLKGEAGAGQFPHEKIFVWEAGRGLRLAAQRQPSFSLGTIDWSTLATVFPAGGYRLIAGLTSADGSTTALTSLDDCNFGTPCRVSTTRYRTTVTRAGGGVGGGGQTSLELEGTGSLSPNGRYIVLGPRSLMDRFFSVLVNLDTGAQSQIGTVGRPPIRHFTGNDGTVVEVSMASGAVPVLRSGAGEAARKMEALPRRAGNFRIDASGRRIFFTYSTGGPAALTRLGLYDGVSGQVTELGSAWESPYDISDDGLVAVIVSQGQLWSVQANGSAARAMLPRLADGEAPVEIAVSGDGSSAFAITTSSRILRLDLRTLASTELVAATPVPAAVLSGPQNLGRGGVYEFAASRPVTVTGVRLLQEPQQPLFAGDGAQPANRVFFQVPFDAPEGTGTPEFLVPGNPASPFQSAIASATPARVSDFAPLWFAADFPFAAALHQDFRGRVTPDDPAMEGEVIHLYGTGFGPVTNPPARGQPAPAVSPLAVLIEPFDCPADENDPPGNGRAEVLWAGLAPGWIGVYQVDVRVPKIAAGRTSAAVCRALIPVRAE